MRRRQLLLFSLLFSILIISMFVFVFIWNREKPLRVDAIPLDAYVVPSMTPDPTIEELNMHPQLPYAPPTFSIDAVMAKALKLNMTFRINISSVTREVQSTVYLGHDSEYMYVGGKFVGMFTNPTYSPGHVLGGNFLQILFDVGNSGTLATPEAGSRTSVHVYEERPGMLFYYDLAWIGMPSYRQGQPYWENVENLQEIGIHATVIATIEGTATYENNTGTLSVLFKRLLRTPSITNVDVLQMRNGERWVMRFLLEMGFENPESTGAFQDYVDGWPKKSYPYTSPDSNNSSWWPKLAIDLSNPPTAYPSVPT